MCLCVCVCACVCVCVCECQNESEQYLVLHAPHLRKTSSLGPCYLAHSQHTWVVRMCSDVTLTDPCVCKERTCLYV